MKKEEKYKILTYIKFGFIAIIILGFYIYILLTLQNTPTHSFRESFEVIENKDSLKQLSKDSLIFEVQDYINSNSRNSRLSAESVIDSCIKYDIDIKFVLAQGHIESGFGTYGIAKRTNSVWNVGSFDGYSANHIIRSGNGYYHPNHSIGPYIQLLINRYMVNGKTEKDLMRSFVSHTGHRYASNPKYEVQLSYIYNRIKKNTNIDTLTKNYKRHL